MWRGGLGWAYPLSGTFVSRCLTSPTMLRFHIPLIEPDVRISRIRLSDKDSRFRPREVAREHREPQQTERLGQISVGVAGIPPTRHLAGSGDTILNYAGRGTSMSKPVKPEAGREAG